MILALLPLIRPFIMPALIAVFIGGLLLYGKKVLDENHTLKENAIVLEQSIIRQQAVIELKDAERESIVRSLNAQSDLISVLNTSQRDLEEKFEKIKPDGSKRDLGKLALRKEGLVEGVINRGTQQVFNCLEDITRNENSTCNPGDTSNN